MKRVLLTSFEPFGGLARNSSLEIGEAVAASPPKGIALDWLVLPVVGGRCVEAAWEEVERARPTLVLALGQSERAGQLKLERLAVNVHDFPIADNAGQRPRDEVIAPDGPAAYFTTIPTRAIVAALRRRKIVAGLSYSAGTYVCNDLLYGLLHRAACAGRRLRVGFMHLPLLPGQGARPRGAPSRAKMIEGVRVALTVASGVSRSAVRGVLGAALLLLMLPSYGRTADEPIFAPDAKLKVEAAGGAGGEGPAWHPKLGVLTTGGNGDIRQLTRDGEARVYRKGAGTNGLLFDAKGRLLACEPGQRRVTRTELDGTVTVLADKIDGKRFNEPNDLTVDSKGRIYFSDPRYGGSAGKDIVDEKRRIIEGVYRIDPDGKVIRAIGRELERPNGVLVSADDRFLYVADNNNNHVGGARKLYRFDLRADGSVDLASKKLLYDWGQGRGPDGVKQDVKGRLYVAAGLNKPHKPFEPAEDVKGGIYVLDPEGKKLAFLPVPRDECTNCAFGGEDLKTLYITAGGTLYSIRTTTPGRVVFPPNK